MTTFSRISSALPSIAYLALPCVVDKIFSLMDRYIGSSGSEPFWEVKNLLVSAVFFLTPRHLHHLRVPALSTYVAYKVLQIYPGFQEYLADKRYTQLIEAVKRKDLVQAKALHQQDAKLVLRTNPEDGQNIMHVAVKSNVLDIIQWVHQLNPQMVYQGNSRGWNALDLAAERGDISILEWAYTKNNGILHLDKESLSLMEIAVEHGQIQTAEWVYKKDPTFLTDHLLPLAQANCQTHMVQWIQSKLEKT